MTARPLAYTIPDAAVACAVGETVFREAVERGDVPKRYPSSRPIVLATELQEWLESLPLSPPKRR